MNIQVVIKNGTEILPGYIVERELGRGGQGIVWLVRELATGKHYAVKTALSSNAKAHQHFLKEVEQWHELEAHPHLVQCFFSQQIDDRVFVFAEYVDGGSLEEWIRSGVLITLRDKLDIAIQLARALQALHEQHLVHQDVKPHNVLISTQGLVKLTDFGLAGLSHRVATDDGTEESATVNGMTDPYRSPEQAALKRVDGHTDQWSWAMTVLAMFAGGRTWKLGEEGKGVLGNYLADFNRVSMLMPLELRPILRRALDLDPAMRWPTMANVAAEFERLYRKRIGTGFEIGKLGETAQEFRKQGIISHQTPIVGNGNVADKPNHGIEPRGVKEAPAVANTVDTPKAAIGKQAPEQPKNVEMRNVEGDQRRLEARWNQTDDLVAFGALLLIYEKKARSYYRKGNKRKSLEYYERGARLLGERGARLLGREAGRLTAEEQGKLAQFHENCGLVHGELGEYDAGLRALDRAAIAIRMLEVTLSNTPPTERIRTELLGMRLAATRSFILQKSGQPREAIGVLAVAISTASGRRRPMTPEIREELARLCFCEGAIQHAEGSLESASKAFVAAVRWLDELSRKSTCDSHNLLATALIQRGVVECERRNWTLAVLSFQHGINVLEQYVMPQRPALARIGLGTIYGHLGKLVKRRHGYSSALEWYARSVEAWRSVVHEHALRGYEEKLATAMHKHEKIQKRLGVANPPNPPNARFADLDNWTPRRV